MKETSEWIPISQTLSGRRWQPFAALAIVASKRGAADGR